MYASGMRSQEVCDLTVGDIQFYQDKACINVHGKGQKIRRIGIPAAASDIVKSILHTEEYLRIRTGIFSQVRFMKR